MSNEIKLFAYSRLVDIIDYMACAELNYSYIEDKDDCIIEIRERLWQNIHTIVIEFVDTAILNKFYPVYVELIQ